MDDTCVCLGVRRIILIEHNQFEIAKHLVRQTHTHTHIHTDKQRVTRTYYVLWHCCWQRASKNLNSSVSRCRFNQLTAFRMCSFSLSPSHSLSLSLSLYIFVCIGEYLTYQTQAVKWFLAKIERTWHTQVAPSPSPARLEKLALGTWLLSSWSCLSLAVYE